MKRDKNAKEKTGPTSQLKAVRRYPAHGFAFGG